MPVSDVCVCVGAIPAMEGKVTLRVVSVSGVCGGARPAMDGKVK